MRGKRHYRCSDAKKTETTPASCKAGYIRADELEQIVWNLVVEAIRSPEVLASEIRKHVKMGTGNLEEERTKLRREIQDLKAQQTRLLEQRQKDFIDQEILESRIVPVKILCDEKERSLTVLDEQRRKKDDAEAAEARIVEFCERVSEGLEDTSPDRKRATLAAFQTKVQATRADLQVTVTVDPCVAISTRPSRSPNPYPPTTGVYESELNKNCGTMEPPFTLSKKWKETTNHSCIKAESGDNTFAAQILGLNSWNAPETK
jgi:hypothetical protein